MEILIILTLLSVISLYSVLANLILVALGIKLYTEFVKEKKYRQP